MSEIKLVSPMLDGLRVVECFHAQGGVECYHLVRDETNEPYVLKHISIPDSETKTQALLFTGAVADEAAANDYYRSLAEDLRAELYRLSAMPEGSGIVRWLDCQIEPREGVGFDVYALMPRLRSLAELLSGGALTELQALNLALDLCDALAALREAGYVYLNLKPENVMVDVRGHFAIGDRGLLPRGELSFCAVPEEYINDFSAPELFRLFPEPTETSDVYSLGLLLYYVFNGGTLPFEGELGSRKNLSRRESDAPLPSPACADPELSEIIATACAADPAARYADPSALRQALTLYMQRTEISDQPLTPPAPEAPEPPAAEPEAGAEAAEEPPAPAEAAEEPAPAEAAEAPSAPAEAAEGPTEPVEAAEGPAEGPDEAADPEPEAEENVSIDELLASVQNVLSEGAERIPADAAPDLEANEAAEQPPKKPRRRIWVPIVIALAVVGILGGALAYFYLNWYLVTMDGLEVVDRSADSVTVSYLLSTPDPDLSWDCVDAYGNAFEGEAGEGTVTFRGLTPGTQYTVRFYAGKLHKLLGTTTISAATASMTQVVSFSAAPGGNNTTAEISLVVSGPEPEQWQVTYSSTASDSGSTTFSGHNVLIPELFYSETYTFELRALGESYLSGETSCELMLLPNVAVSDFRVSFATEDSLSLSWESLGDQPPVWRVQCVGEGFDETQEVSDCSAVFHGTSLGTAYTFTLTALGLEVPQSISLPANATVITSFDAEPVDAGTVEVSWNSSEPLPEGGWKLRYLVGGDLALSASVEVPNAEEADEESAGKHSAVLTGLPANSEIDIFLEAADGDTLIGFQHLTVSTPEAPTFTAHDFDADGSELAAYPKPRGEDWRFDDLGDAAEEYEPSAPLAVVLTAADGFRTRDRDETAITLVVRDETGKVRAYAARSSTWNDLWTQGRYLTSISLPAQPGRYQLELYFDHLFVRSTVLTIPEPEPEPEA